jgi:hypothetical protein
MNVWYNGDTVYLWKILSGYIELENAKMNNVFAIKWQEQVTFD